MTSRGSGLSASMRKVEWPLGRETIIYSKYECTPASASVASTVLTLPALLLQVGRGGGGDTVSVSMQLGRVSGGRHGSARRDGRIS